MLSPAWDLWLNFSTWPKYEDVVLRVSGRPHTTEDFCNNDQKERERLHMNGLGDSGLTALRQGLNVRNNARLEPGQFSSCRLDLHATTEN